MMASQSISESESETDSETEEEAENEDLSIEEKIIKEEKENEKGRKRKEEEFEIEREKAEAKRKELEHQAEVQEAEKRKDLEIREQEKLKEMERQEEAKKRETERQEEEKRKELERQAEEKRKELERQAEAKKKELERQAEEQKKEEELELTKKQLKEFVERWNSHPNSPYLIGTPISLDLQRIVRTEGWHSRDSFASVIVAPPSDPGEISEPDDDVDATEQDDFIRYTIEPQRTVSKQPSPEEVAKELEERLSVLQREEMIESREVDRTSDALNEEVELQNKANIEKSVVEAADISQINNNNAKAEMIIIKEPPKAETKPDIMPNKTCEKDIPKSPLEVKRKTAECPKESKDSKLEKHKKAYEERKRKLKILEEEKKNKEEAAKVEEGQKNEGIPKKNQVSGQISSSLESLESTEGRLHNPVRRDETHTTNRIRPPERMTKPEEPPQKQRNQAEAEKADSASETLKKINEKSKNNYKKEYEEYLKMISESQNNCAKPQVKEKPKEPNPAPKVNKVLNANESKMTSGKLNGLEKSASVSTVKELEKKEAEKGGKGRSERKMGAQMKKLFTGRFRFGKEKTNESKLSKQKENKVSEEKASVCSKPIEVNLEEHKKLYQEYLKMVNENPDKAEVEPRINEGEKIAHTTNNKPLDSRLQPENGKNLSITSRELQRKVSDSYKASELQRKSSSVTAENLPKEPLKRPEIIALQNEEFGGSVPRQRKISVPHYEGGECIIVEHDSRPSSPGSPHLERSSAVDNVSRSSTPTKQIRKQPSRDVPLSTRDDSARQRRPSRDVPVSYITVDGNDSRDVNRRLSRDLTPEAAPPLSRKTSREERSPSRGGREGTPSNRRPSRDVPLTPSQLERLTGASALPSSDQVPEAQAWPDVIVVPQGEQVESDEECHALKDSLDIPVATLVKSPSGTLLSVPGVTVSQHERGSKTEAPAAAPQECKDENSSTYVTNNKLVAWILDIGNTQIQRSPSFTTSDRVSQWESRDSSPRPVGRASRDPSPRPRDRSPVPSGRSRDKSPVPGKRQPSLYPLSREPSTMSLKSSGSSDNLFIQTPWGAMKRSPSRTNLSNSPSFEMSESTKESQKAAQSTTEDLSQYSQSDDHMSVDSSTRSPSPKMTNNFIQKQDTLEISEIKDFQSYSRLSDELPPKPPEKGHRINKEENLNINNMPRIDESKCHTVPRSSRLMKTNSVSTMKSLAADKKLDNKKSNSIDNKVNETGNTDSLKRKSKFPQSPNQKKKLGPLLFSAQDRISQFEKTQTPRAPRPITRTRSNMVFSKAEKLPPSILANNMMCDENKNAKTPLISSKSTDKTHVKYLTNRLLDKVGKPTGEVIQNVDSLNNNVGNIRRNSCYLNRRDSTGMAK